MEIVNFRGGAAFARPPIPSRAKRGEEQNKFELFLEYTADWNFANEKVQSRGARCTARLVVEKKVERVQIKRPLPFNLLEAVGFLKKKYEDKTDYQAKEVDLPEVIETYEQLDDFPLSDKPFQELARILGKSVRVFREDGGTDDRYLLFTAHPSGEVVEAAKTL